MKYLAVLPSFVLLALTALAGDGDWKEFTPAERAAFAFTVKLTNAPHTLSTADWKALRAHYKELQVLEIVFTVANNNSTTRWTDSLSIPTEEHRKYLTPTSET